MKKRLIGRCTLGEEIAQLFYYVTEKKGQTDGRTIYGIEIRKCFMDNYEEETESAFFLSYSGGFVEKLAKLLYRNQVTPMCMLEIIDENITKELSA